MHETSFNYYEILFRLHLPRLLQNSEREISSITEGEPWGEVFSSFRLKVCQVSRSDTNFPDTPSNYRIFKTRKLLVVNLVNFPTDPLPNCCFNVSSNKINSSLAIKLIRQKLSRFFAYVCLQALSRHYRVHEHKIN